VRSPIAKGHDDLTLRRRNFDASQEAAVNVFVLLQF